MNAQDKLTLIRLVAMDVDGVLTDGGIIMGSGETESKRFHIADGLGMQLLLHAGIRVAWITGRESEAVRGRAQELGVEDLFEKSSNKSAAVAQLLASYGLTQANIAYVGDDLNDLPAFSLVGVKFAPANAVAEIKALADFVTEKPGGEGAVREVCDVILKAQGKWNDAVTAYLSQLFQK